MSSILRKREHKYNPKGRGYKVSLQSKIVSLGVRAIVESTQHMFIQCTRACTAWPWATSILYFTMVHPTNALPHMRACSWHYSVICHLEKVTKEISENIWCHTIQRCDCLKSYYRDWAKWHHFFNSLYYRLVFLLGVGFLPWLLLCCGSLSWPFVTLPVVALIFLK
jgi:hypothetical protein